MYTMPPMMYTNTRTTNLEEADIEEQIVFRKHGTQNEKKYGGVKWVIPIDEEQ